MQKRIIGFSLALFLLLCMDSCGRISKCKKYLGDYNDRGNTLSIKYDGHDFTFNEGDVSLPCICNNNGLLEVQGQKGPVAILLSDSAGIKRFCFEEDSLHEDCIYEKQ